MEGEEERESRRNFLQRSRAADSLSIHRREVVVGGGDRSTVACCKARLSLLCVPSTPCVQRTRVMDVKRAPSPSPTEPLCAQRRQSKSLARAHSARHTVLQHVRPSASHQHLRFGIPVLCTSPHPPTLPGECPKAKGFRRFFDISMPNKKGNVSVKP